MSKNTEAKPRVIRHHFSGVWICYIDGEGELPNTIQIRGRRVHSWKGGRLETSQLATQGAKEEDRLGDWIQNSLSLKGIVDVLVTTPEIVEHCKGLPVTVVEEN